MLFVLYGVLAQVPIADMFIAGIIPGLIMSALFFVTITLMGLVHQYPPGKWLTFAESRQALLLGLPALAIPVLIIGGILSGLVTPTESAALASMGALLIGRFVYKELRFSHLPELLKRTALNSGMVIVLISAAGVFGWVLVYEHVPQNAAAWIVQQTADPFVFLLMVVAALLLVGMVLDGIAALILVVPILLPVAQADFGISPYQFGVVVCLTLVMGLLTPPVGAGLFISAAMTGESPMRIFKALLPFLLMTLVTLVLLSWKSELVLILL
jgi:tripartite ATP-independent transporter DctM subunit